MDKQEKARMDIRLLAESAKPELRDFAMSRIKELDECIGMQRGTEQIVVHGFASELDAIVRYLEWKGVTW